MNEQVPSKEWGDPAQVRFTRGFVLAAKQSGRQMCPLHVDFLLWLIDRVSHEPAAEQEAREANVRADSIAAVWIEAYNLLADDAYAASFQSIGQYRTTVLGILRDKAKQPAPSPISEHAHTGRDASPGTVADGPVVLASASQPPSVARFRIDDRVEWTNMLQNTFIGSVRNVASEHRYIVQFDDGTVGDRAESELRAVPTKGEAQ